MCEAYPDAFGVFSGYADDLELRNGISRVGNREGLGFERRENLTALMRAVA